MRAGVVVAAQPGVERLALKAEELGLHSFWVNDTPMVHGDPFIALGLCAQATTRIKLGVGVTSPMLRSAPAAASALASLNALAPGRIICGVGTGNTARRTLGMRPTTAATLENFIGALQDLCAGRPTEYREGDQVSDVRFLHTGKHVNTGDPIEFVVGTQLGPKAAAVAARRGTGVISFALPDPAAWRAMPGHPGDSYLLTSVHVLDDGDEPYGDAAKDATGHIVMSFLAFAADTPAFVQQLGEKERAAVQGLLERRGTTGDASERYMKLYANYLGRIAPQDRDLILPSLMDALTLVGTRDQLLDRIAALEQAGVDEIVIQPVVDPAEEMARLVKLLS